MVVYRVLRDGMEDEVGRRKTEEPFIVGVEGEKEGQREGWAEGEGSAEVAISKRRRSLSPAGLIAAPDWLPPRPRRPPTVSGIVKVLLYYQEDRPRICRFSNTQQCVSRSLD